MQTSYRFAVLSLVFSIVGIFGLFFFSYLAVIFGFYAAKELKWREKGVRMAYSAIVTGLLGVLVNVSQHFG